MQWFRFRRYLYPNKLFYPISLGFGLSVGFFIIYGLNGHLWCLQSSVLIGWWVIGYFQFILKPQRRRVDK